MEIVFVSPSTPGRGARPGKWFIDLVALLWRKPGFHSLRVPAADSSSLGLESCVFFPLQCWYPVWPELVQVPRVLPVSVSSRLHQSCYLLETLFLWRHPWAFRGGGLTKTSHLGLSASKSLTLCLLTGCGFLVNSYILQEEASLMTGSRHCFVRIALVFILLPCSFIRIVAVGFPWHLWPI